MKLVDKAAKRNDAYELVRLAYAYPAERASIDQALVQVAQRLGSERKGAELARILTLPETAMPWLAANEAMKQLVRLGPQVVPWVRAATYNSHKAGCEGRRGATALPGPRGRASAVGAAVSSGSRLLRGPDARSARRRSGERLH